MSVLTNNTPLPGTFDFHSPLDLNRLRSVLIRLEDSIIFALIERAQFRHNTAIYKPNSKASLPSLPNDMSFFQYFLSETEKLHSKIRRYTSPDEHPFTAPKKLPTPILPELKYPPTVKDVGINFNDAVLKFYQSTILPGICVEGDDQNYGSSALADIAALQLLSKRIHYGLFVAEIKLRQSRAEFEAAIRSQDKKVIMALITKPQVEAKILDRVYRKAVRYYGSDALEPSTSTSGSQTQAQPSSSYNHKITPALVKSLYGDIMIMTKEVQLAYLLKHHSLLEDVNNKSNHNNNNNDHNNIITGPNAKTDDNNNNNNNNNNNKNGDDAPPKKPQRQMKNKL
jgi:chorismate mutase